ncbi:MAG TPA: radical SAM protein [Methylomirabilota bacterium]|jgi:MoaA/NifB/PqqE/SkfB family radical SAM enzyme|nr:radical SAM protein [Methylomirabilota bacterium]
MTGTAFVFDMAPRRVYWEITRACDLVCRHCRAEAAPAPDPSELTQAEGLRLLDDLARFGHPLPHVVLTGGDPLKRADVFTLIRHARGSGLGVSVAPSATPLLTDAALAELKAAGAQAISLSLDGSTAARHAALRGVPGCFARTMEAVTAAREVGLPFQLNTLVSAETIDDLPAIRRLASTLGAARWSLFFLVTVGRGAMLRQIEPQQFRRLLDWLLEPADGPEPVIATTEAPQLRRLLLERRRGSARAHVPGAGIRDGNGIMFVSHTGSVTPAGFLPLSVGNVRTADVVRLYREAPLFRALRRAEAFGGRCGACEFRDPCGGSRARAYAATGDPCAEDPLCPEELFASMTANVG